MNSFGFRRMAEIGVAFGGIGLFLASESHLAGTRLAVGTGFGQFLGAAGDPMVQWALMLCGGFYFAGFCWMRTRQSRKSFLDANNSEFWLAIAVGIVVILYTLRYPSEVDSAGALIVIGGAVLGQGVALWSRPRSRNESEVARIVIWSLLVLLFGASLWWGDYLGQNPQYHGQTRWSGPWDNPNTYGLLIGTSVVLAVAEFFQPWRLNQRARVLLQRGIVTVFLAFLGIALLRSYSRGAWLGVAVGCGYLMLHVLLRASVRRWNSRGPATIPDAVGFERSLLCFKTGASRAALALVVIVGAVFVLLAFTSVHGNNSLVRRVASVINANDFSSRNRLASYEGALRMIPDKPYFGFGWEKPEPVYAHFYRMQKLEEGRAISTNDYFVLATTLGMPVLVCFVAFIWLGFIRNTQKAAKNSLGIRNVAGKEPEIVLQSTSREEWRRVTCRAAVIVLLIGFWFDGGLFKLPTAATFWILLELGRRDALLPDSFAGEREATSPGQDPRLRL